MCIDELINYIESIGFKNDHFIKIHRYEYKNYIIYLYEDCYSFYNGSEWIRDIDFNDLTPIEVHFKKELRSIKLKQIFK